MTCTTHPPRRTWRFSVHNVAHGDICLLYDFEVLVLACPRLRGGHRGIGDDGEPALLQSTVCVGRCAGEKGESACVGGFGRRCAAVCSTIRIFVSFKYPTVGMMMPLKLKRTIQPHFRYTL